MTEQHCHRWEDINSLKNPSRRQTDRAPKTMFVISIICVVLALSAWLRVTWVMFYPYKPFEIVSKPQVLNEKKEVVAGDDLLIKLEYVKRYGGLVKISATYVNSFSFDVTPHEMIIIDSESIESIKILLPTFEAMPSGAYYLIIRSTVLVSELPTRHIEATCFSEPFQIVKKENKKP
jgi:hypothetical protein